VQLGVVPVPDAGVERGGRRSTQPSARHQPPMPSWTSEEELAESTSRIRTGNGLIGTGRKGPRAVDSFFRWVARAEAVIEKHVGATVLCVSLLLVIEQRLEFGRELAGWDWPSVSAGLIFALALPFALRLPKHTNETLERLARRRVLVGSSAVLRAELASSAENWSRIVGPVTAALLLAVFGVVWGLGIRPMLVLFAGIAGFFAGRVIGRALAVSRIGLRIERGEWMLRVQPGHVDGAAGLEPIGELYFRHAMILAIPAAWLAIRLVTTTFAMDEWRSVYLSLLLGMVGLEVIAFVGPMMSFHRIMISEKRRLLLEADGSSERICKLEKTLTSTTDEAGRKAISEQVEILRARYQQLEQLPTWPVDATTRKRFALRNIALLIPATLNAVGMALPNTELWNSIINTLTE
jgi:hypothetical protein